jgi:hypothetical protein
MKQRRDWIAPLGGMAAVLVIGLLITWALLSQSGENNANQDQKKEWVADKEVRLFLPVPNELRFQTYSIRLASQAPFQDQITTLLDRLQERCQRPGEHCVWPLQVKVRSAYILKSGTLILDLEKTVQYNHLDCLEEAQVVRAILKTVMTYLPKVKNVQFLENGQEAETFAGHILLTYPLTMDDFSGTLSAKGGTP